MAISITAIFVKNFQNREKAPTHISAAYAIKIFIKISRTEFPGNQVKNFISWDSEFFTESESLFGLGKISTEKILATRNSAYLYMILNIFNIGWKFHREILKNPRSQPVWFSLENDN